MLDHRLRPLLPDSPATVALLVGVPTVPSPPDSGELVTPTGAAIVTTLATSFGPLPAFELRAYGHGAGTRELADGPNILRLLTGPLAPAEAVEGVMISDRVAFSLFHFQQGERTEGVTYPPSYVDRLAALRVDALDIPLDEVRRFATIDVAIFEESTRLLEQGGDEAHRHPVASLRKILASTRTYHNIALDLLSRGQPRWPHRHAGEGNVRQSTGPS